MFYCNTWQIWCWSQVPERKHFSVGARTLVFVPRCAEIHGDPLKCRPVGPWVGCFVRRRNSDSPSLSFSHPARCTCFLERATLLCLKLDEDRVQSDVVQITTVFLTSGLLSLGKRLLWMLANAGKWKFFQFPSIRQSVHVSVATQFGFSASWQLTLFGFGNSCTDKSWAVQGLTRSKFWFNLHHRGYRITIQMMGKWSDAGRVLTFKPREQGREATASARPCSSMKAGFFLFHPSDERALVSVAKNSFFVKRCRSQRHSPSFHSLVMLSLL